MPSDTHRRLEIDRQPIPKQDPKVRVRNWDETSLGFGLESAKIEATRCIQCPTAPCQEACPVHNDIPGAFLLLEQGDVIGAANTFRETSNLPEMCGRLCPQERLCEGECVVAFAIRTDRQRAEPPVQMGKLEAFAADYRRRTEGLPMPKLPPATGRNVAVVGAGPAGLAVAEQLTRKGHHVMLFDAWPEAGGVLRYGIPSFKLEKETLEVYLDHLWKLGIEFTGSTYVGREVTIGGLLEQGYPAVFLGHGASLGNELDVAGTDLPRLILPPQ